MTAVAPAKNNILLLSKELMQVNRPEWGFEDGVNIAEHVVPIKAMGAKGPVTAHEFVGTDNFGANWYTRQEYEVDAGRDEEPILYTPIYQITENSSLPKNVSVNRIGPAGVTFSAIEEGGEVKFATVGESNFSVQMVHYAVGLEYSKDLVVYNELWSVAEVERQLGTAYNALLNHVHLNPIITATLTGDNYTDGTALSFDSGATMPEKYLRTLEQAITDAVSDTTNPRRGPYALLVATGQSFMVERSLLGVPQQGFTKQSSAAGRISTVITYDGWTGSRGNLTTTYGGVDTGYAYLIDLSLKRRHFRSYMKQGLQREMGNPDVSRFILEQTVWDSYFTMYADTTAAVQRIKWPV